MDKLLFDAKCRRCNSVNEIDFISRFNNGFETPKEVATDFLSRFNDWFVADCPECKMKTIHEKVTLIKD